MKIDRLLGETIYLLNHGRTSAQILAKYFEVSVRTIVRDMDTLSMAGIPIIANCGADGGYDVMDTFKMQRQVAGQTDYNYIICALQGLATAYENKNIEATLEKMKALTDHKESSMLMDLSVVHENRDINEMLYLLNHSIEVKHIISFLYTNSRNEENLECKRNIRSKCREYLNGSIIEEYDNGDFRYEFEVPAEEQFWYGVVLSFGKDAKVISPYEVIEKIKNTFNEVMELYGE